MKREKSESRPDNNSQKTSTFLTDSERLVTLMGERDKLDREIDEIASRESFHSARSEGQRFPMRRWDSR